MWKVGPSRLGAATTDRGALLPSLAETFLVPGNVSGPIAVWSAALLVALTAGMTVWRSAVHAGRTGRPAPSGLRAGLCIGLGMLAGELMLARTSGNHQLPRHPLILLLLAMIGTVTVWWTAQCA